MGIDDLLAKLVREVVTPVTLDGADGVTAEASETLAHTLVTPVTPQHRNAAKNTKAGVLTANGHDGDDLDDRRFCWQCASIQGDVCGIAFPGGLVSAIRGYRPVQEILRRCAGYVPKGSDKRTGRECSPDASQKGAEYVEQVG